MPAMSARAAAGACDRSPRGPVPARMLHREPFPVAAAYSGPSICAVAVKKRSADSPATRHSVGVADGWSFKDAWLLTALGQFGRAGCELTELLGAADALNHDVPSSQDLERGLGRLIASGLASAHDQRLMIAPAGGTCIAVGEAACSSRHDRCSMSWTKCR